MFETPFQHVDNQIRIHFKDGIPNLVKHTPRNPKKGSFSFIYIILLVQNWIGLVKAITNSLFLFLTMPPIPAVPSRLLLLPSVFNFSLPLGGNIHLTTEICMLYLKLSILEHMWSQVPLRSRPLNWILISRTVRVWIQKHTLLRGDLVPVFFDAHFHNSQQIIEGRHCITNERTSFLGFTNHQFIKVCLSPTLMDIPSGYPKTCHTTLAFELEGKMCSIVSSRGALQQ